MSESLFTYGTLQFPEVMQAVTGTAPSWTSATASGFAQYRLVDRVYPGMTVEKGGITSGIVYHDLSAAAWILLDAFEDVHYQRVLIQIGEGPGIERPAFAYIIPPHNHRLLSSVMWSKEWFAENHLTRYLIQCKEFYSTLRPTLQDEE